MSEALSRVFRDSPGLRSYVLDDQGRLRTHVVIYVDGRPVRGPDGARRRRWRGRGDPRHAGVVGRVASGHAPCTSEPARGTSRFAASGGVTGARNAPPSSEIRSPSCCPTRVTGGSTRRSNLGHFGVKLRVSEDGGASFAELPAPAHAKDETSSGEAPSVDLLWCLEPAGPDPGSLWCGTIPGGLFRSDDGGRSWGAERGALEPAEPRAVVRRRLSASRNPLGAGRAGREPGRRRGLLRRRLDQRGRRGILARADRGHVRGVHAARDARGPRHPGPAPARVVRRGPPPGLVSAPQRFFPFRRRRRDLDQPRSAALVLRVCGRRPPGRSAGRLERAPGQGRMPRPGRLPDGGGAHPGRRRELGVGGPAGCPRTIPSRWCTATVWTSIRAKRSWRWAPPRERSGSPRTSATRGIW